MLEVKLSDEESKFGIIPEDIHKVIEEILKIENLNIKGLMTMAPYFDEPEKTRPYFKKAKELFEKIKKEYTLKDFSVLSMGMSGDFEQAILEGATMVRIGTALFGERKYE